MIKSIEPYSSTKGTLREEVCSRLIKPTTQVYLGNVGLLTEKNKEEEIDTRKPSNPHAISS
jgi:hypothetical protein